MDPYRSAGTLCPDCPEVSLREFGPRLVCDNCHGLLMTEDDLVAACSDQVGHEVALRYLDEKPTQKSCPRCDQAMTSCHLGIDKLRTHDGVLHCSKHGVWIDADVIAAVFARLGHTHPAHGVGNRQGPPAGWGQQGLTYPSGGGGAATEGLAIGNWANRPRRTPAVTPVNLYSDRKLPCPACATTELVFQGDRWTCTRCTGAFLQNAAFESLVLDMSHRQWTMPPPTGTPGQRACPVCTEPMLVEKLEELTLDRCAKHGIWFDARELTLALERASGEFSELDAHGVRGWLHRVFHR